MSNAVHNVSSVISQMNRLKEIEINTEATDYIEENYSYVLLSTTKMALRQYSGCNIAVEDLLHDLYEKLSIKEKLGRGYCTSRNITVEQFVFGSIQKYMKNAKYRGQVKKTSKGEVVYAEYCESHSEDMEKLYNFAADMKDEISDIESRLDMSEEIYHCLRAGTRAGVDMPELIKNSHLFNGKRAKNIMPIIKRMIDSDGLSTLASILEYRKINPCLVDSIVDTVTAQIKQEDAPRAF